MPSNNIALPRNKLTKTVFLKINNQSHNKNTHHSVLRLPPYYCVLNVIELFWRVLKKVIFQKIMLPEVESENED